MHHSLILKQIMEEESGMDFPFPYLLTPSSVIHKNEVLHCGKTFYFDEKRHMCLVAEEKKCNCKTLC